LGGRDLSVEQWPMHDRSDTGLGVVLKGEDSEWVKVGKLLALRLDPAEAWVIGVVRRITRLQDEMRMIGVQIINASPVLVQLEQHESAPSLSYAVDDVDYESQTASDALAFPTLQEGNLIVLESARYAHGRQYKLRDAGGFRLIRLEAVRDKGEGWLMTTFSQLA
jgi:hypothetical protein